MGPKHIGWRLALGALVLAGGAAAVVYATTCPKGFVRFSGYEDADTFGCIDYGGISTPEHYLQLRDEGRVGLFGGPFAGEGRHIMLLRTGGEQGKWICGHTQTAQFAFEDGKIRAQRVTTILDEGTAQRDGTLTLAGLAGGVFGDNCASTQVTASGNVLQVTLDVTGSGGGANRDRTRLDLTVSGRGITIATKVSLDEPWPERGDVEREVRYAWVRLAEVIDGQPVRRIAAAGPGSRLLRKDGCATLELVKVTPLATCPAPGEAGGELEITW